MKHSIMASLFFGLITLAYFTAQSKTSRPVDLSALHLNMAEKELEKFLGTPYAKERNQLTYILEDSSQLFITIRDGLVASARVMYYKPLKIQDPQLRQLTFVQMDLNPQDDSSPSWFFAGQPAEGLIYKVTQNGEIESLTWVPPFTYSNNQPKHLQALLQDFHSQHVSKL